jgi:hypothetical protein
MTDALPPNAPGLLPVLRAEQVAYWPDHPAPRILGGLIEQESCITLRHPRCWSPRAELRTSREYGFGLGQTTIAYRPDGSERFNVHQQLRRGNADALREWTFENRFDARLQLRAVVLLTRSVYREVGEWATPQDRLDAHLAAYNGGAGHVLADRRLCAAIPGCDPLRWRGHVELRSVKSRVPMPGYGGQSPYSINRAYPRKVEARAVKYAPFLDLKAPHGP